MEYDEVITKALIRILENQISIKEHLGLIKRRSEYADDSYAYDAEIIRELEKLNYNE